MRERWENLAIKQGIFVQQTGVKADNIGWCVTFPRLSDKGSDVVYPTPTLKTFNAALGIARIIKRCDSRLARKPIYCLQMGWRQGFCGQRILQLVER